MLSTGLRLVPISVLCTSELTVLRSDDREANGSPALCQACLNTFSFGVPQKAKCFLTELIWLSAAFQYSQTIREPELLRG